MNFKNKTILISGGTGSWGQELTTQLLKFNPKEIRIYSRGELAQVKMKREFNNPKLKFIIGDVRDYEAIHWACKNVNYVFHLAALKHVPVCEEQPNEAIKTNIVGTQNIIKSAIYNNVEEVIDVSSDKACSPINLYGMTKAVGEKLITNASTFSKTKFMVIRGGNAMGSNGSVIPLFINQIKQNNKITITDERMTRFFITLPEAIQLLFIATGSVNGGLFVMKMPACRIEDLALVLIEHYGNKDTKIEEIGIRPGEKLHEVLVSKDEVINTYKYKDNYYLIYPNQDLLYNNKEISNNKEIEVDFKEYSSNQNLMDKIAIKDLLIRGGFII